MADDKPTPRTLRNWSAARSGSSITVHGTDIDSGEPTKLTRIESITPPASNAAHEVTATDSDGVAHRLIFA